MAESIAAHGGKLVNRWLVGDEALALAEQAPTLRRVHLATRQAADLELLAVGAYSPLDGFMGRADYLGVVEELRLACGQPWPLPITLAVPEEEAAGLREGQTVALADEDELALGLLEITEVYRYDKESEARAVYGTNDESHPGVADLYRQGDILLAGPVRVFRRPRHDAFAHYRFDPAELRGRFGTLGWQSVACARVAGPGDRAGEYLQKCVLETVDGLLLHAAVGPCLADDPAVAGWIASYEVLLRHYYPRDRATLAVLPAARRHAGPRETLLQAIVSQNYGCSHFLIERAAGERRDGALDEGKLFARFAPGELGIRPLFLGPAFYCRICGGMATVKTCPHDPAAHLACDEQGEMAAAPGGAAGLECLRPEVARALRRAPQQQAATETAL